MKLISLPTAPANKMWDQSILTENSVPFWPCSIEYSVSAPMFSIYIKLILETTCIRTFIVFYHFLHLHLPLRTQKNLSIWAWKLLCGNHTLLPSRIHIVISSSQHLHTVMGYSNTVDLYTFICFAPTLKITNYFKIKFLLSVHALKNNMWFV